MTALTAEVVAALVRFGTFAAIMLVTGAAMFDGLVLRALRRADGDHARAAGGMLARAARIATWSALALVALAALRLVLQVRSMEDPETPWLEQARVMVTATTWGTGWMVLLGGALLALAAFARARRGTTAMPLAAGPVLLLSLAPALSGHAVGDPMLPMQAVFADSMHMLAAGAWLGTLAVLAIAAFRAPDERTADGATCGEANAGETSAADAAAAVATPDAGSAHAWRVATIVHAFSPIALASAAVLAATGTFAAWLHLDAPASLWTSLYGRLLLAKLALLAGVMSAGAFNWKRVTPRLGEPAGVALLRRSARVELAFAAALLAATALLVATPLPGE